MTREIELRTFIKILSTLFLCTPLAATAAPIAQTAGSNLTQYNGAMGSVVGNQWNNATNPRNNAAKPTAAADFGNCNSLILRCATPKCSGGGCANMDVAKPIVAGCVNSNATCKKHGDDLINAIAAQLVSDSIAAQNAAAATAAANAAAAEQNNAALQQQLQSMQQQMSQMQQQNSAQINSLQQQLADSQRSNQEAINAATAAAARTTANADTGLTPVQEAAAKSGVSDDVIARATITGQILTSMDGVDSSLNNLKTTMRDAFRYAKCNEINGNNCSAPKRVAKFRELANKFMEPYDALADNLDDALFTAQSVGVDLGNIYMFFSGSCNRWAEYVCRGNYAEKCTGEGESRKCESGLPTYKYGDNCTKDTHKSSKDNGVTRGGHDCYEGSVIPPEDLIACTPNKYLDTSSPDISEKILNPDQSSTGSVRIGCASDSINNSLIRRRRSSSKNKSGIDIDLLEILLNQKEPGNKYIKSGDKKADNTTDYSVEDWTTSYCAPNESADATLRKLRDATISKSLGNNCCDSFVNGSKYKCESSCYKLEEDVSRVNSDFALCDTHAWNAGFKDNDEIKKSEDREKMNEIIALKTTVIAQQMYKQYATLEQMIKQLKVMLEKEVLKASVQVAGGTSSDTDTTDKVEFDTCSPIDEETALSCLRSNYSKLQPYVTKKNLKNNVKKQLTADSTVLKTLLDSKYTDNCKSISTNNVETCFNGIAKGINDLNKQIQNNKRSNSGGYIYIPGNNNG